MSHPTNGVWLVAKDPAIGCRYVVTGPDRFFRAVVDCNSSLLIIPSGANHTQSDSAVEEAVGRVETRLLHCPSVTTRSELFIPAPAIADRCLTNAIGLKSDCGDQRFGSKSGARNSKHP